MIDWLTTTVLGVPRWLVVAADLYMLALAWVLVEVERAPFAREGEE